MVKRRLIWVILGLSVVASTRAAAQPGSRAAVIEAQRQARLQELAPDEVSKTERFLRWVHDDRVLERLSAGFNGLRGKLGGMVTGGGFGFGPEYYREDLLGGSVRFRTSAQTSVRGYTRIDAEVLVPEFARRRAFLEFRTTRRDSPSLSFYGTGAESRKEGRSNYRLEDVAADGMLGVRLRKHLRTGVSAGYVWVNVGPGTDRRFASTDRVYSPAQAPGIDQQANFLRYGAFLELDYRDDAHGPRSGGKYYMDYTEYSDRRRGIYGFRRFEADLEQYIGLCNQRRVFVLRGQTVLTEPIEGGQVPFYLQPDLGGSQDLRGFRPFRFRGNHVLILNAEYRWEVFSGLDMALFADGGKVFARRSQLNFHDLEGSAGFGFRFNARNRTFLRLDVGFSHEGFQVWFKFNDVFGQRRLGTAGTHPVP